MRKSFIRMLVLALLCLSLVMLPAYAETQFDVGEYDEMFLDITSSGTYTIYGDGYDCTIRILEGVNATITLDDLTMYSDDGYPCIEIEDGASVTLIIKGECNMEAEDAPCIMVEGGKLTIKGDGELYADTYNCCYEDEYEPAAIGSAGGDFTGSITIEGDVSVYAYNDNDGAAIGSGMYCDMDGAILIEDNAYVEAYSDYDGAGIGSGEAGEMSGSITIRGNAVVEADSDDDGPGIGSGAYGDMSGSILITGDAVVDSQSEDDGAGIGTGEGGNVSGSIIINGNAAVYASGKEDSAGIGAGEGTLLYDENDDYILDENGDPIYVGGSITETGRIIIGGSADVTAQGEDDGAGIGSAQNGVMAGLIVIQDNATVHAISGRDAAAIGSDDEGEMPGRIRILNNAVITIEDEDGGNSYIGPNEYGEHNDLYLNEDGSVTKSFVISEGATINGVKADEIDDLYDLVDYYIAEDGTTPNIELVGADKTLLDTGDHSQLVLWAMMVLMGGAMLMLLSRRKAHA